jgi:hypothetical protein
MALMKTGCYQHAKCLISTRRSGSPFPLCSFLEQLPLSYCMASTSISSGGIQATTIAREPSNPIPQGTRVGGNCPFPFTKDLKEHWQLKSQGPSAQF